VALTALRRAIHLGLLQEATTDRSIEPFTCANCHAAAYRETFCSSCGIALRALPKGYRRPAARRVATDEEAPQW
jgi:hypothetical protein